MPPNKSSIDRLTVNVEEREESENCIAGPIGASVPSQMPLFPCFHLHQVGDNISVRQHNTLRSACCATRINQKRDVLGGVFHPCSTVLVRARDTPNLSKVLEMTIRISLVVQQDYG